MFLFLRTRPNNNMINLKALSTCIILALTLLCSSHANSAAWVEADNRAIDLVEANKEFNQLATSLKSLKTSVKKLNRDIERLDGISDQAQQCIENTTSKINSINLQIKIILGQEKNKQAKTNADGVAISQEQDRVDSKYLNEQKQKLTNRQAKCRLLVIRVNEVLSVYRQRALSLQQEITFTRGESISKRFAAVQKEIKELAYPAIISPIAPIGWLATSIVFLLFAVAAVVMVYGIRKPFSKVVRRRKIGFKQTVCTLIALITFSLWLFDYQPFIDKTDNVLFSDMLVETLLVVIALVIVQFLMAIRRVDLGLNWYGIDTGFVLSVIQIIILLFGAHMIGTRILTLFESGSPLKQLFNSILMMISLFVTVYFTYRLNDKHQHLFTGFIKFKYVCRFVWLLTILLFVLDIIGYNILAINIARIFFSLVFVSGLSLLLLKGLAQGYEYINYAPNSQAFLKRYFGYIQTPPYFELALLKLVMQVILIISVVYIFAFLIGEASYFIDNILDSLYSGFVFADYRFKPTNWLAGIIVFCGLVILFRYLSRRFTIKVLKDRDEDTQVARASILLYIGFSIAVIAGLLVAGFNFTSLTIIAGALSVGIGLGLQSIVNNFISGIILLIEKPIKVGDRIALGDVEGFVKKVRVRSTQIETPAKEDIIIPNSDLITQQVTNFMFANQNWRVKCTVGVAYDSDTELVRQVLLEVARNHNEVLDTRGNKPWVYFKEFGDNALIFELWCMINNVNKKYQVIGELNFAIEKAFRAQNIVIAFPQRDLHIKYEDLAPLPKEDKQDSENE